MTGQRGDFSGRHKHADLLLVGGGHAHVAVLADWIGRGGPPGGVRAVLLTPERYLRYSGMVPGWIAGQYAQDDGLVDIAALANRAGAQWIADRCCALDPDARVVTCAGGGPIAFTIASVDTGGAPRGRALLGDDPRLLDVRPIGDFVERFGTLRRTQPASLAHILVAGGGAGGVELAFALRNMAGRHPHPRVTLAAGERGVLPDFAPAVRARVARALAQQGIVTIAARARIEGGVPVAGDRALANVGCIIAAPGSAAPGWVRESGVATDGNGFIAVDAHQRSVSHPHILAAGDVAARADRPLAHSGVHAVKAGPVLAANLRCLVEGKPPRAQYRPRAHSLYLLNTGNGRAIAAYGTFAAEGRWVLALKHRIDKAWIAQYAGLAAGAGLRQGE